MVLSEVPLNLLVDHHCSHYPRLTAESNTRIAIKRNSCLKRGSKRQYCSCQQAAASVKDLDPFIQTLQNPSKSERSGSQSVPQHRIFKNNTKQITEKILWTQQATANICQLIRILWKNRALQNPAVSRHFPCFWIAVQICLKIGYV